MSKKPCLLYTAIALLTAVTFLWNQCVWAIGLETLHNNPSDNSRQDVVANKPKYEKNLPQNLQRTSPKVFSRFLAIPTEKANFEAKFAYTGAENPIKTCVIPSGNDRLGRIDEKYGTYDGKAYKWQAISYDELGRPTAYKEKYGKVSSKHYDIQYNELGDVAYEKIKVTAKSGGLIKSKTTVVTEYWYGYDEYGQHEKIKENEIYRKTSTPIIGRIIQAVIAAVTAVFTAGQSLWVVAAWMAASSFVSTLIMTGDIRQALLSAAISFATSVISQYIQGIIAPGAQQAVAQITFENFFKAFMREFIASEVFEFVSARGPPFLAYLASVFVSKLLGAALPIDYVGVLPSTTLELLQKFFSPQALIYDLVSAVINQLIDNAIKDGRISAEVGRVLRALSLAFASALIQSAAEKIEAKMEIGELKRQGYQPVYNRDGQIVLWVKTEGNSIIYYNPDGSYNSTDVLDENNNLLYRIESGPVKGSLTYIDPQGTPIFTTLPDGRIISYDINGNLEGILAKDALPYWTDTGEFRGSYKEKDIGKEYYDKSGEYEAFILDGFEPVEFAGKIYFQQYKVDENTYIIADQNGQLQGRAIYDYTDTSVLKGYGWVTEDRTSYYDASGNLVWYRTNEPNSAINFYDSQGNLISQLFTQVDKNGVVEGYLYNSLAQDQFAFMDQDGRIIPKELASGTFVQEGQTFTILPGTKILVIDRSTGKIQGGIFEENGKFILYDPVTQKSRELFNLAQGQQDIINEGLDKFTDLTNKFFENVSNVLDKARILNAPIYDLQTFDIFNPENQRQIILRMQDYADSPEGRISLVLGKDPGYYKPISEHVEEVVRSIILRYDHPGVGGLRDKYSLVWKWSDERGLELILYKNEMLGTVGDRIYEVDWRNTFFNGYEYISDEQAFAVYKNLENLREDAESYREREKLSTFGELFDKPNPLRGDTVELAVDWTIDLAQQKGWIPETPDHAVLWGNFKHLYTKTNGAIKYLEDKYSAEKYYIPYYQPYTEFIEKSPISHIDLDR